MPEPVLRTAQLILRPILEGDVAALFGLFSEPAGWWFDPDGRHTDPGTTRGFVERAIVSRREHGLGYWIATTPDGEVVGTGGVRRKEDSWNLAYRVAEARWGRGFATEIAKAGLECAHEADPRVPVLAWIDTVNEPSRAVARKIGLTEVGLRTDPTDGVTRVLFADRGSGDG